MPEFNGLNGTIMLNTNTMEGLPVGSAPGEPYGFSRKVGVRVDIRIERLERRESYQTTEHQQIVRPYGLSVTTQVWSPGGADMVAGGATRDPLREVTEPSRFWTRGTLAALATLGDRWHGNDFQAACAHQDVVYEDGPLGRRPSLDLTLPCTSTGYRYGSAWLVEPLPEQVIGDLMGLLHGPIENRNVFVHPDLNRFL